MNPPRSRIRASEDGELSREKIVGATGEALRRYGPAKITVIDVARALGVSHGSIYRYFKSKAALLGAVIEIWLRDLSAELALIARGPGTTIEVLETWLAALWRLEMARQADEPEMFATYQQLAHWDDQVVNDHYDILTAQLAGIIRHGVAIGEMRTLEPAPTARSILDATLKFHHPGHAASWNAPSTAAAFQDVWTLIRHGVSDAM